jgi:hypothetical protein
MVEVWPLLDTPIHVSTGFLLFFFLLIVGLIISSTPSAWLTARTKQNVNCVWYSILDRGIWILKYHRSLPDSWFLSRREQLGLTSCTTDTVTSLCLCGLASPLRQWAHLLRWGHLAFSLSSNCHKEDANHHRYTDADLSLFGPVIAKRLRKRLGESVRVRSQFPVLAPPRRVKNTQDSHNQADVFR